MRTLQYLIESYPNKTGKEILEIQRQDKIKLQNEYEKTNKINLDIIKDIETNGGYFKGNFGLDQYYMCKILKIYLLGDELLYDCEKIILFDGQNIKRCVIGENNLNFEIKKDSLITYYNNLSNCKRIKEEEYVLLKKYLFDTVPKFFKKEFNKIQKEFK